LFQNADVPVFAEHQRHHDPVVARAHLPVGSPVPLKFSVFPSRNIRRRPVEFAGLLMECCGLMMEMWADGAFGNMPLGRTVFDRRPHAATAKALMINSAYRYPVEGTDPVFTRFKQGWGMPDLGRLYESRKKLFVVDQEMALRDHQAVEYRLRVPEGEPELRVTLAYTDPLGTTATAKVLVNDLDLIVIAPDGKRYCGNHGLIDGNVSRAGGTPDRLNNVENVFLDEPVPGVWQVIVAAHRIAWDQHHGTTACDQDYALVVNAVEPDRVADATQSEDAENSRDELDRISND